MGTSAQILLHSIFSCRALVFTLEGHSAKPVFVGSTLIISLLSAHILDFMYSSRANPE